MCWMGRYRTNEINFMMMYVINDSHCIFLTITSLINAQNIRMKPAKCTRVIVACAVLDNLRLQWGELKLETNGDVADAVPGEMLQDESDGRRVRNLVVS